MTSDNTRDSRIRRGLDPTPPDAPRPDPDNANLVNALEHIRVAAALHYLGGAFDPEHMRAIANLATEALNGNQIAAMPDPEGLRKDAHTWAVLYEEQCVDVETTR